MGPVGAYTATQLAAAILGGMGGPSDATLTRRMGKDQLLAMRGQDILNPDSAMQAEYVGALPYARQWGAAADKKFGRNSGQSFKAIMQALLPQILQRRTQVAEMNAQGKANRDLNIAQALIGYDEEE